MKFLTRKACLLNQLGRGFFPWHYPLKHVLCLLLAFAGTLSLFSQPWTQLGGDIDGEAANDQSGVSVSLSDDGSRVAIGAPEHDGSGSNAGQVRVFAFSEGGWAQLGADIDGEAANDNSGHAVSLNSDGSRVAIGAYLNDGNGNDAGHVRVYEYSGGSWTQLGADIDGEAANDQSGWAISLSRDGNRVAIGARGNGGGGAYAGHVRIFEYSGGSWTQVGADIDGEAPSDFSGHSVSLNSDGSRVAIGARGNDGVGSFAGHVRVFEYSGGNWTQLGPDFDAEAAGDEIGWSVSLSSDGNRVAMGAHKNDGNGSNAGHVRVFAYSGGNWSQLGSDIDGESASNESGYSVSLSSDGSRVAIGARYNSENGSLAGHVRVYDYDGSAWTQVEADIDGDAADDQSGFSVSLSGDGSRVAVGAPYNSENGFLAGHARVFEAAWNHGPQGGYALEFDGVDDYVAVAADPALNFSGTSMTLEAWIYPTAWTTEVWEGSVVVKEDLSRNGYMLRVGNNGQASFTLGNGSVWFDANSAAGVLSLNEWQHLAGVVDAGSMRLYLNGREIATATLTGTFSGGSDPLLLGSTYNHSGRNYAGKIDDVRIWSDARSQAEIQAHMHKVLAGDEANLVAYYAMYEGSGTSVSDNSNNGHTGTLTNGPLWKTSGVHAGPGMALDFDGTNDYVLMGSCPAYSTDLTYEAWIKLPANPFVEQIIGFDGIGTEALVEFRVHQNKLELLVRETSASFGAITGTSDLTDNTWHHVAAVKQGTTVSLYVDGVQEATGTMSLSPNLNYMAIGLLHLNGIPFVAGDYYLGGQIDEVRIWSAARTEAEIRAHMYRTLDGDETGLEAYYRFDQQAAAGHNTLYDLTGNGYDGTLTNMDPATAWVAAAPFNTWIGSEDGDWSNAANWSRDVAPTTEAIGVFGWSGSNAPASASISAGNAYIGEGASIAHSGNLTLSGDLTNNGTFTTTGTVTFSGTSAQAIQGTGNTSFGTLRANNSAGVNLQQDLTVTTDLDIDAGTFAIGVNTLTLNGTITQTAGSLTGGATANLIVGGTGASTSLPTVSLNNLTLNRANGLSLSGDVTVDGTLTLTDGVLDASNFSLTIGSSGSISGASTSSYVRTSGTGVLRRNVGASNVSFPVGNSSYNPLTLNNSGTADDFSVRVADEVLDGGTSGNTITEDVVNRTWFISEGSAGGSDLSVTFTWYTAEEMTGFDNSSVQVKHYTGGAWANVGSATAPTGTNPSTYTVTGLNNFSPFAIGDAAATLPVEWLDFEAMALENKVRLDWSTAREMNSDYFAIERSVDQFYWQPLGEVAAAGYSETVQGYQFVDESPVLGTAFYRLRQVDLDGAYEYSPVVEVSLEGGSISIYPNPVQNVLQLELAGSWTATLTDLRGKILRTVEGKGQGKLPMGSLPQGMYLLNVYQQGGKTTRLIQKQ